jgi:uncharacterized glyoxalase superfamily protein PhnB
MKMSFARIVTADVPTLMRFYQQLTGLTPHVFSEFYVEFERESAADGSERGISGTLSISDQAMMDAHGAHATTPRSNRSMVLDFQVEDVDRECARIREFVNDIVLPPTNQPWGNRSMLFRDPDGNLINFFAPVQNGKRG